MPRRRGRQGVRRRSRSAPALAATCGVAWLVAMGVHAPRAVAQVTCADSSVPVREVWMRAEDGDRVAAFFLGCHFASGTDGPVDHSAALEWFTRAAEDGLQEAQYEIGRMYARGLGVERSPAKAAEWFRAAADQGHPHAQYALGTMYALGRGVLQDHARAASLFRKAADHALPQAQFALGYLYEYGRGVRLSGQAALVWYERAADQGYEPARARLDALLAKLRLDAVPESAHGGGDAGDGAPPEPPAAPAVTAAAAPPPAPASPSPATPGGLDWLARVESDGYTLQLLSDTDEASVRRFVESRFGDDPRAGYFAAEVEGKVWYSAVYGEFPTYDAAQAAAARLPDSRKRGEPWVRKIRIIQDKMLR